MADFKKGDVVRFKSGGPKMTVTNPVGMQGNCQCQWFAGAKAQTQTFDPEILVLVKDEDKKGE